jgi:hypothetical protein
MVFVGESSLEGIDLSSVGVLDSECEQCLIVFVEEIPEFVTKKLEMVRPRNNVSEGDDSFDCILDARNASVAVPRKEISVPIKDLIVVWWCTGRGQGCNPIEDVVVVRDGRAMFKPLRVTKGTTVFKPHVLQWSKGQKAEFDRVR